ncbi:transposable element Tcb1 transposase [Trichonephila clavipes]|nr:transposable element Tcb1 transposase [Trichonephila clavipes]
MTVSRHTVYRRLGPIGLYARRPVRCVPLTATHCRLRLTWSRQHALWTPQQWSCVMFPDESSEDRGSRQPGCQCRTISGFHRNYPVLTVTSTELYLSKFKETVRQFAQPENRNLCRKR